MPSGLRFQLWEYRVSHGMLLIRSPRLGSNDCNDDILFAGVEYLSAPRHLGDVTLAEPTHVDITAVERASGFEIRSPNRLFVLDGDGRRFYVVAASVHVTQNTLDIFDSVF